MRCRTRAIATRWPASRSTKAITARPGSTACGSRPFSNGLEPIHEGNGEAIAFVDENADEAQREALLKIMTGQDTDPFATMFAVYASTVTKMNDPVFTKIDLELDIDGRKGRIFVKDYIDTKGEPIRNKVTGAESRAQIVLPDGFEYTVAEIGSASSKTKGPVQVEMKDTYGQFARLHLNNHGVVRA